MAVVGARAFSGGLISKQSQPIIVEKEKRMVRGEVLLETASLRVGEVCLVISLVWTASCGGCYGL